MAVDVTADINGYRKPAIRVGYVLIFTPSAVVVPPSPPGSDSGFIDFFQKFIFHFFYIRYV